jgi:(E)-4-hydroxy-3-methylbut-2-enyl-diphosphate synthase
VFIDERKAITLRGEGIAAEFKKVVEDYIEQRFGGEKSAAYGRN